MLTVGSLTEGAHLRDGAAGRVPVSDPNAPASHLPLTPLERTSSLHQALTALIGQLSWGTPGVACYPHLAPSGFSLSIYLILSIFFRRA